MYNALLIILLLPALALIVTGLQRKNVVLTAAALVLAGLAASFFLLLDLWGEMLWFQSLGFVSRFWTEITTRGYLSIAGGLFSLIYLYFLVGSSTGFFVPALLFGLYFGSSWGLDEWQTVLLFIHRSPTDLQEPILHLTTGFYLFTLPFLDALFKLLLQITGTGFLAVIASRSLVIRFDGWRPALKKENVTRYDSRTGTPARLYANGGALVLVLAFGAYLQRYHLLFSSLGIVTGPGWTDVHIRLPGYTIAAIIYFLMGCWLLAAATGRLRLDEKFRTMPGFSPAGLVLAVSLFSMLGIWLLLLTIIPNFFQWLRVEPNEITFEEPYIKNNIDFTRYGFGLHDVEEREFPASGSFDQATVDANPQLLNNIRLWDPRALDAVYKQFQEIRLYYEFVDVDIDRYVVDDKYRQVMVSAREMQPQNLPDQSKTFINLVFKYTHGYGITLAPVSKFTPEGLPDLLIKDIPPKSSDPSLEIVRPQIYYGELTKTHVITNTSEAEFDYPKGEENAYIHYPGKGGVPISSLWRKFIFGWKFDGTRLFLSDYPTPESRILFHRQVHERLQTVAPFLHFDDDAYIVLLNGRLYWIVDGYTTSHSYPYSEPFYSRESIEYRNSGGSQVLSSSVNPHLNGINYIRNSVKAVVDAFDGTVDLYVFAEKDPLIRTWRRVFPDLFKDREEMVTGLLKHVRYPLDMLLVQGLVYAKYHMTDPRVFYNQEDLWIRATEKYYNQVRPINPYYVMWEMPGTNDLQFVLILPFTPKKRQVLIGWIAGMCDGPNYGRFLVYKFPKEKRILGPQQVETKIDQDRFLSGQLTLWDQRGSQVIRGNVLAIPIEKTILYVEPIYLQAETAAYPELRLVVLMHNDRLTYGPTFDKALEKMLAGSAETGEGQMVPEISGRVMPAEILQQAQQALEEYLRYTGEGRFQEAADSLAALRAILQKLTLESSPQKQSGKPAGM
jgi:uncharacterized membrane protein (UPF0182 family)